MNKVTVCICVYNGAEYIEETLFSICNQSYKDFDLLIIDDCSTDRTVGIVESFLSKLSFNNFEILKLNSNGGIAHARHIAVKHISTQYIIFVDADDRTYPDLVKKLLNKIESDTDLIAVGCYLEYMDKYGNKIDGGLFIGCRTKEQFYKTAREGKLIFMPCCAIFNREVALSVGGFFINGFPPGKPRYQDMCEDLELWTRMSDLYKEKKAIVVIPEVLCQYRKMENTVSTNTIAMKLRMMHIKSNLKLRRSGQPEVDFVHFLKDIDDRKLKRINREIKATDNFRNFGFAMAHRKIFKAAYFFMIALLASPKYVWDKILPFINFKLNSGDKAV